MKAIPFFDLNRQNTVLREELLQGLEVILQNGDYIEGNAVKELEKRIGAYLNVKHVVTCGNGTEALALALRASGVGRGDEVITTPFTFAATAEAIVLAGAEPVFVDIDRKTLNLDASRIQEKITEKTKALLPVHIFGNPCDMKALHDIAKSHHLKIVEDACQAIGSDHQGIKAGKLGDAAAFSFYPTKNLGGCGDGGMVTTDNDVTAVTCRALKAHGAGRVGAEASNHVRDRGAYREADIAQKREQMYDPYKYFNYLVGGNSRLDSFQAAVLLVKLQHLERYNERRRQIACKYCSQLQGLPLELPQFNARSCWHQFAVLAEDKDGFMNYMDEKGIGTGAFYSVPLHLQKAFQYLGYSEGDLPAAEEVCRHSVCLPVFPELTEEETDYIIETVRAYFVR